MNSSKRLALIIIMVMTAFMVIACFNSCFAKELKDTKWGYRVEYPNDWTVKTFPNSKDLVKADINKSDNSAGIQVRIYPNDSGDFKKFAQWKTKEFTDGMKGHWGGNMKVVSKGFKKIGKHDGFSATYELTRGDGQKLLLKEYMWPSGKQVYVMQGGMPYKDRTGVEPILEGIARSFDLLK